MPTPDTDIANLINTISHYVAVTEWRGKALGPVWDVSSGFGPLQFPSCQACGNIQPKVDNSYDPVMYFPANRIGHDAACDALQARSALSKLRRLTEGLAPAPAPAPAPPPARVLPPDYAP